MNGDFGHLTDDADNPVGVAACPAPADGDPIELGTYWPPVSPADVRVGARLQPSVTPDRLRNAITIAILDVVRELAGWQETQRALGYDTLADVPGRVVVDGKSDYELLWLRAITEVVAADLSDRLRGMSATHSGHDRADELESEADEHRKAVRWAIRDFLGQTRIVARLV